MCNYSTVAEVKNLEEEGQTEELRVDCYECVVQCLRAAERTHARLMQVLMVRRLSPLLPMCFKVDQSVVHTLDTCSTCTGTWSH